MTTTSDRTDDPQTTTGRPTAGTWRPRTRALGSVALVAVLAVLPLLPVEIPYVFGGPFDSPGVLNLLALMLVFGAVALTYDLLFGFTGLLSFGHSLYFALGTYGTAVAINHLDLGLGAAVAVVAGLGIVVPLVLGAICLRVSGIALAMVTLAFAQAGAIFVARDPLEITGGELGLALEFERLPPAFVGVVDTANLYWLALGLAVAVYLVARVAVRSRPGRVWLAIRENERRVEVLGLRPYGYKLGVFVLASFLASLCGVVYVLLVRGAHPDTIEATFTLTLLVMVVLGGTGTLWGAVLGGMLYTYLDHRLVELSSSDVVAQLPGVLAAPLSEPQFILGALFVVLVLFFPGGIAALASGRNGGPARDLLRRMLRGKRAVDGRGGR
ncbi:MAG: branched-chain amino acid ABC transporter permease [Actinomycetia bacterium]|nr:branched-chain amino acid ABC transporter permease [Actinomycetes bacterium]